MIRVLCLGLFAVSSIAYAAPTTLVHQGRALDSQGNAFNGEVTVVVSLWTAMTEGTEVWTESHADVPFSEGYYAVELGVIMTLDTSVLVDNATLFVQTEVDGTVLATRQAVQSVPFARVAGAVQESISIVNTGGVRKWSDGSAATTCEGYRRPAPGRAYRGDIGNGLYSINPYGTGAFAAPCEMTLHGGG